MGSLLGGKQKQENFFIIFLTLEQCYTLPKTLTKGNIPQRDSAGSGSKELTLGAALIDFQGSVRGHSSLSRHPSGIYYLS